MEIQKKNVLLTGGTSFIGRNLIEFLKRDFSIINLSKSKIIEGLQNVNLDLTTTDLSVLDNFNIDYVVHLAAFSSPARSTDEKETLDLNHLATKNLLTYFSKRPIKKFIFMSSVAVYEDSEDLLSEESSLQKSPQIYSKSKILAEKDCIQKMKEGMPIIIFRLSNAYGPEQQWKKEEKPTLIPQLITQALSNKKIEIFNGKPIRDYIYISDVCQAIINSIDSDFNGILNLGTGKGSSAEEVAKIISNLTNSEYLDLNKEVSGPKKLVLDISKTSSILSWKPKVTLEEGLSKTIEYYSGEMQR